MRGFFVLLVLTNLLIFGWQLWVVPASTKLTVYSGDTVPNLGLTLLAELEDGKMPPQRKLLPVGGAHTKVAASEVELIALDKNREAVVAAASSEAEGSSCYQSTSLETIDDARSLQQSLALMGIKDSERKTVQTQKINYWLMLPADKEHSKVSDVVAVLKKQRIKDFFVVRSGRYEGAISLGVYSTRERAEQRYKQINGLKLRLPKPVIEALELPAKQLVIWFQLRADAHPEDMASLLDNSKQPHLEKISCN